MYFPLGKYMTGSRKARYITGSRKASGPDVTLGPGPWAIAEVDHAAGEAALVHQVKGGPRPRGEGGQAAAHQERRHVELVLIDQAGADCAGGEGRAADADVAPLLQRPDRLRVEAALDPRPRR